MVTLGTDSHKQSHTVVAVDENGRQLREPNLPVARLEGKSRELKLLVDHREDLVGERTRIQNRLLWHLHELEPGLQIAGGGLTRKVVLKEVKRRLEAHQGVVSEIARE